MRQIPVHELILRLEQGDWRILGRAVSVVENDMPGKGELLEYAYCAARENCLILGITGAGGAGKSTLIDKVVQAYRKQGQRVGVLTVDPSSPYTGGAVLGDRIRMGAHSRDDGVFIRSFGSRGAYGGISQAAKEALYLYKAFGFDIIIVESLGVGQAETDITDFVDVTAVVLAPGNGDHIQLAKAGTLEIADLFVINKADRPEAEILYLQMLSVFDALPQGQRPVILKTVASENKGIDPLLEQFQAINGRLLPIRATKKHSRIENEVYHGALRYLEEQLRAEAQKLTGEVLTGELTPFQAAALLGSRLSIRDHT